jgi:hypothetical protein
MRSRVDEEQAEIGERRQGQQGAAPKIVIVGPFTLVILSEAKNLAVRRANKPLPKSPIVIPAVFKGAVHSLAATWMPACGLPA